MATVHPISTIVSDPQIHDGQPIISGTRLRVMDLAASHLYRGLTPDALADNYALTLGQVYAALAYYYQHRPAIDAQMQAEAEAAERYRQQLEARGKVTQVD